MTTNHNSERQMNVEHGIKVPSFSTPAPNLFFPANFDEPEKQEDLKNAAGTETITPWKYWGFEAGNVQTGWEWGKSRISGGHY